MFGAFNRLKLSYCFAAFLVFLGGAAIYVFFRNHDVLLFQVFPKPLFLETLRFPVRTNNILMSMFLFNLPDGLWFLSGLLIIRAVWLANHKWRAVYACLFAFIALFMEILQIFENIPGTFDVLDIVFMAFFGFAENVIYNIFAKRRIIL